MWDFVKSLAEVQKHFSYSILFIHPNSYFVEEGDQFCLVLFILSKSMLTACDQPFIIQMLVNGLPLG